MRDDLAIQINQSKRCVAKFDQHRQLGANFALVAEIKRRRGAIRRHPPRQCLLASAHHHFVLVPQPLVRRDEAAADHRQPLGIGDGNVIIDDDVRRVRPRRRQRDANLARRYRIVFIDNRDDVRCRQ